MPAEAEVEALLAATANLSAQADPDAVLRTLVEQAALLFEAGRAVYAVRRGERIVIPADWQAGTWVEGEREAVLTGIVRLVWQSGRPYRSNDVAADPNLNDAHVKRFHLRSQLAVPLLSPDGERLGIISLDNSRRPAGFSARDERLLAAICETGAAVLVRAQEAAARLQAEHAAAESKREVEALLAAADQLNSAVESEAVLVRVVSIAVQLLGVERCGVVTDEEGRLLLRHTWSDGTWRSQDRSVSRETSLTAWVIREGRPYRSDDFRHEPITFFPSSPRRIPATALAVPIVARDAHALGVLQLFDRRDGRPFSDDDQRLAEGIAHP